jgi:hypothetical protein
MKKAFTLLLISFALISCQEKVSKEKKMDAKTAFNEALANELERMAEIDQVAAYIPQGKYKELSRNAWKAFKDSVFTANQKRASEIFDEYGFVGFDLVGETGSQNFWMIVQHSDHAPEFQKAVLEKMKVEVDRQNAVPSNYGLLVDRVNLNTGKAQVYGTQVTYNMASGQAYPKTLADSANVNARRISIGLAPLEDYLNEMTKMHFEMNKENYIKKGVLEPTYYSSSSAK